LQETAIETLLLPSRLRNSIDGYSLLELEQLFTAESSRRNILQAGFSVNVQHQQINGVRNGSHDLNANNHQDIQLFPGRANARISRMSDAAVHRFAQLSVYRGMDGVSPASNWRGEMDEPVIRSYASDLAFPCPSSFPHIFGDNNGRADHFEVKGCMETTSLVSKWLRGLAGETRILPGDEREDIRNDLNTWADEYVEGWESGDDGWDD
jgi:hypothetical protein